MEFKTKRSRIRREEIDRLPHLTRLASVNPSIFTKGTGIWKTGRSSYTGEFQDGKPHGKGKHIQDGTCYEGYFHQGRPHGQGTYTWEDGTFYSGNFDQGAGTGHGCFAWKAGARYDGNFEETTPHGNGTLTYIDGIKFTGRFSGGTMVCGHLHLPCGISHPCDFSEADPAEILGIGIVIKPDGTGIGASFSAFDDDEDGLVQDILVEMDDGTQDRLYSLQEPLRFMEQCKNVPFVMDQKNGQGKLYLRTGDLISCLSV